MLTIPLRYSGTGVPAAIDVGFLRIVWAVTAILGRFALIVLGFLAHERSLGTIRSVETATSTRLD